MKIKFGTIEEAFKRLAGNGSKVLTSSKFNQAINELFKGRFQPSDIKNIWKTFAGGKDSLDYAHFAQLHGNLWQSTSNTVDSEFPKDSWRYQDFSIIKGTTVRSSEFEYEER